MAIIANTSLTRYTLADSELLSGQLLTEQNLQVLQNLLADASEEKIALKFDVNNPQVFIQAEAELQGKIGILRYIVECSIVARTESLYSAMQDALNPRGLEEQ